MLDPMVAGHVHDGRFGDEPGEPVVVAVDDPAAAQSPAAARAGVAFGGGYPARTSDTDDINTSGAFEWAEVIVLRDDRKSVGGRGSRDPQVVDVDAPAGLGKVHP